MDRLAQLAEELDLLHRGRGFNADDVMDRLGPILATIVFSDNEPDPAYGRDLLRRWLLAAAGDLPDDLRQVFLVASGLRNTEPQLTRRLESLADEQVVSTRTVRRRLREADRLVAAALEFRSHETPDENPFAVRGWYVDRLESIAHLDLDRPVFESLRDIIVTHDDVEQICESWSIPKPPDELLPEHLDLTATEGCEITGLTKISPSTWRVTLDLPGKLEKRRLHRVGLRIALPSHSYVQPFNAFVPVRRTRSFRAEVRYSADNGISDAWRINGLPPLAMDDYVPIGDHFDLAGGEPLVAEWNTVRRGLGYGIGWTWHYS